MPSRYANSTIELINSKIPTSSKLTAISFNGFLIEKSGRKRQKVLCICECKKKVTCVVANLLAGTTRSCGCLLLNRKKTHCLSRTHPLYGVWVGIKRRCYVAGNHNYHLYGAKGVKMCKEWRNDFMVFYNWSILNGWAKGLQIDRINPFGNYTPENCRYVTNLVNIRNRRNSISLEFKRNKMSIKEWSDLLGIPIGTIFYRFKMGMPINKILTTNYKKHIKT